MTFLLDREYGSEIRAFKWKANLNGQLPVILIRSTIIGGATPEIVLAPYPGQKIRDTRLLVVLFKTLKHLPSLGYCKNLDWLACELSLQVALQFRFSPKLFQKDPDHVLVIIFDVTVKKIKLDTDSKLGYWEKVWMFLSSSSKGREDVSVKMPQFLTFKGNEEWKDEKVEEIEECQKGMKIDVFLTFKGNEAIGAMKIDVFGTEEEETECPICLENICVDNRFATTSCLHRFHKTCISKWVICEQKETCPVCRSSFDVSI